MLARLPNGNLEVSVRPPLVYLDHWAIREISSDPTLRAHFLETFRSRGTLMFSLMNVLEMARNSGESYVMMRDLLDAVEPYWLLSDPDAGTAHAKELRGLLPPETFLVPLNVFGVIYKSLPEGTLRLGSALETLQDEEFRERARGLLERPAPLRRQLAAARKRRQKGEIWKGSRFPKGTPLWIGETLSRFLIEDGKSIKDNDVVDLFHATVPLRYAVIVLLDKAWASFAKKLDLDDVQIFAKPQLDDALEAIRAVDISRHRIIPLETSRGRETASRRDEAGQPATADRYSLRLWRCRSNLPRSRIARRMER